METKQKTTIWHAEAAKLIGIEPGTFRNWISQGRPVPPSYRAPGARRRVWIREEVIEWIKQFPASTADVKLTGCAADAHHKKIGRPTKAQQIAAREVAA